MNIDKDIARKVMGWTKIPGGCWMKPLPERGNDLCTYVSGNWTPSTNIKHAMEVEAEMFRQGLFIQMDRSDSGRYSVFFYCEKTDEYPGAAGADNLPEAICLAALKAVG